MRTLLKISIAIFLTTFLSCKSQTNDQIPLILKDLTNENEKKNTLFVFVGEKLDFVELPYEEGSMDGGFKVKYKILQRVYGNYLGDTIEFNAYDHYGIPPFSKFKNVLLFVSEYKGKYYHEKYQFFDVYNTKNNRWASSYKQYDYGHSYNANTTVKPEKIDFVDKVAYPTIIKYGKNEIDTISYPKPYYETIGDSAFAVYGNYVEELFRLKKEGVLTARELFGDRNEKELELGVQDIELAEIKREYDKDDLKFIAFWKLLAKGITKSDLKILKRISLDSLRICDTTLTADRFMKKCYSEIFDKDLILKINEGSSITYTWVEADYPSLLTAAKGKIKKFGKNYRFRQIEITKVEDKENPWKVYLDFIETRSGYKFYGCGNYGDRNCCR